MIIFYLDSQFLHKDKEESRKKLEEALHKFYEADKELERVCKELGIKKPEMYCEFYGE